MDLTLNDFRNILGKVNDGDAVFTKDNNGNATGIEKANYGKLRTHNVKGVTVDDSVMIREEFVAAIRRASGSGKLDIVNNHKTWTIFNHKSVDGTDAYAIRVAFAKAMEAGGLDKKAMKTVRKALGLGPGNTLSSGTAMTPLTRQQVRELIDANITAHRPSPRRQSR